MCERIETCRTVALNQILVLFFQLPTNKIF
jgi:hypothetical protein